jgi:signal transduction histidine kinase
VDAEWIKSPTARRVLAHWADARPAWLWSQDGETLLWRNEAARFFHGKMKKHGVKLAPEAVPIRGQIARLLRLGSVGRSSLSRIQFLAGDRPISTTCSCTPLMLADGGTALLIVGVDAIEPELLEAQDFGHVDPLAVSLFPEGTEYLLVSDDSQIVGGSRRALERFAPIIESEGLPELAGDSGAAEFNGEAVQLTRFTASPQDAMLLLFEGTADAAPVARETIADIRKEEGAADGNEDIEAVPPEPVLDEPWLPMGLPAAETPETQAVAAAPADEPWVEPIPEPQAQPQGTLSTLFDRLADDPELYTALGAQDETFVGPPPQPPAEVFAEAEPELPMIEVEADADAPAIEEPEASPAEPEAEAPAVDPLVAVEDKQLLAEPEVAPVAAEPLVDEPAAVSVAEPDEGHDPIAAMIASIEAEAAAERERVTTWRIIGRGFEALGAPEIAEGSAEAIVETASVEVESAAVVAEPMAAEAPEAMPPEPDQETVERVSRYNFDELSRILTDRVSGVPMPSEPETAPAAGANNALVSLSGETFILNRLPLGIMVFRDQQVLFANRALTELTGYDSIDSLRAAGLTAIFPAEDANAGPVTQLVRRDGSLVPVGARLQSINWHGRAALMLSASIAEPRESSHEVAVRNFAELNAEMGEDGFFSADRSGVVTGVSLHARILLGETEQELLGRPLGQLITSSEVPDLRRFLERPARFAETERPSIMLTGNRPDTRLTLFAEGQAGVVTGYFGLVRRLSTAIPVVRDIGLKTDDLEPSMLTRISRGVRRPLNSIIGFAELIRSSPNDPARHQEYARDVRTAGEEIATLVDELDDFARLREGRYEVKADDIELAAMLDTCLSRVRVQAAEARVLVRSAVSEQLPRVTADRASLTQAILNLLASAIDQTPAGGTVILSAQREDDGAIVINVRDSGEKRTDLGERFVVFRDGVGKDGETLMPVRSSVGLALTRSLLAVNALKLNVDPAAGVGTLFSLVIPAELTRS